MERDQHSSAVVLSQMDLGKVEMRKEEVVIITVKYVTKPTDELIWLRNVYFEIYILYNGLKSHKVRYKSRGNNAIKPFQFACVQPVFLLVTSFVNKLWLLEMYLLKGAKSLSEETETVFTAL